MIQITHHMRIFLAVAPADFRKGIDGLRRVCRQVLSQDPFSGGLFVFMNKRRTALKLLVYDGQGFCHFCKSLSRGRFDWRPDSLSEAKDSIILTPAQLHLLLWNGDPWHVKTGRDWKTILPLGN